MKIMYWRALCLLYVLLVGMGAASAAGPDSKRDLSPREIYEQTSSAVVMVMGHSDGGKNGSGGTGSIIQADGIVLTNAHVVVEERTGRPYPRLSVFLKPTRVTGDPKADLSRMVRARVIVYSEPLDLALLKLEGTMQPLPVMNMSGSDRGHIGDRVVAIGHPEQGGLWTLTTGVISAEVDNFNGVKGKNVFQTETGLNRGNSGGPLLDGEGHMIGVNTAIARVASDGLPITSISFSLKSSVAAQWLRDQHIPILQVNSMPDGMGQTHVATEAPPSPSSPPPTPKPLQQAKPNVPAKPTPKASPQMDPPRPYNLDQLISERSKAEADLNDMISDMRGRMKGR